MNNAWSDIVITDIIAAIYVAPHTGHSVHTDRPYHGLVLNDGVSDREYYFDDGRVLYAGPWCLYYLPKHSNYFVKTKSYGGCYAINFNAEIEDVPFGVELKKPEPVLQAFRTATDHWKCKADSRKLAAMQALYTAIFQLQRICFSPYVPSEMTHRLLPAVEMIDKNFADNDLTVSQLAALCDMSEVYFRRLFLQSFQMSPKEYIIQKRLEYAKTLLSTGDFAVSEVAVLCGYEEPCHFSREFTRRVGVSPSRYA